MGRTFKDFRDYRPKSAKRRGSGFRRGCKHIPGVQCSWCEDNLRIKEKRLKQVDESEWEEVEIETDPD